MRKLALGLLMVLLLEMNACVGLAAPSLSGTTGMIRVPTADVLKAGRYAVGQYYWEDQGSSVWTLPLLKGMEVSGKLPSFSNIAGNATFNVKYNLNQEALLIPAVAVGIEDMDGKERRSVYWSLSKALPYGIRVHLGSGTGRFEGFFFAAEKVLNPRPIRQQSTASFPVTSIIVEYDGVNMNYAARMRLAQGLRFDVGWLGREQRVYFGLTYSN